MESLRPFERVYTMPGYHDGPRQGIADFDGRPHAYAAMFDNERDDDSDVFELRLVGDELLRLALESWEISGRYWRAIAAGRARTEPRVLPADRARHAELEPILAAQLAAISGRVIRSRATWRHGNASASSPGDGHEVQWTVVPASLT